MGLASYIINFDELKPIILDAINNSTIKTSVDNVVLDNTSVTIDTSKIEGIMNNMLTSIKDGKDISTAIKTSTDNIADLLSIHDTTVNTGIGTLKTSIEAILTNAISTYNLLEDIRTQISPAGTQMIVGKKIDLPAIKQPYSLTFVFTKDILISGISMSQTAWTTSDNWNLNVGSFPIFTNIYTKNRGEHKHFERYYPVPANTTITFVYNNDSATNKTVWVDFEYIEVASTGG